MTGNSNGHKTWREKLSNGNGLPKIQKIHKNLVNKWGKGTVVIPAPKEVDEIMKKVPGGKVITINQIRETLARKHGTTICCPLTTGMFVWIAAHAAEEAVAEGLNHTTPYWRTLKAEGLLNEKYPGGIESQKKLLEMEGLEIIKKRKNYVVAEFKKHIAVL
jgi:alkylated DNA nucleotide flippase Atl1